MPWQPGGHYFHIKPWPDKMVNACCNVKQGHQIEQYQFHCIEDN